MKNEIRLRLPLQLAVAGMLMAASFTSPAFAQTPLGINLPGPAVVDVSLHYEQNGIAYMTGGIGDDERALLEKERANFSLNLLNAAKDGSFVDDIALSFQDRAGKEILTATAGPMLNAALPPGVYSLTAKSAETGQVQKKTVRVPKKGSVRVHLVW